MYLSPNSLVRNSEKKEAAGAFLLVPKLVSSQSTWYLQRLWEIQSGRSRFYLVYSKDGVRHEKFDTRRADVGGLARPLIAF